MRMRYIIMISWRNLMDSKIRTVLTIMGVVIGVCAITFLTALGYGFERMTTSQVAGEGALRSFDITLDESDIVSINDDNLAAVRKIEGVELVEPSANVAGKLVYKNVKTDVVVNAWSEKYFMDSGLRLLRGTTIKDVENKVLLSTAALELLGVEVNDFASANVNVEMIPDPALSPAYTEDDVIIAKELPVVGIIDDIESPYVVIPFEFVRSELKLVNYNLARVVVNNELNVAEIRKEVQAMGFSTSYIGDTISQINSFFTIFRYVISGFGVIGMLVAILGMFNTMTVSLLERTREIGILKSNGATRKVIWRMFLTEAIIISFVGGIIGLGLGTGIGELANYIFNVYALQRGALPVDFFYVPWLFVVFILLFGIVMGFFIGLYPSQRASGIRILDALKYE